MAKYLDCTIQNGVGPSASGTGTPSDPYVLMTSAYAGTATGETLYVKTTEAKYKMSKGSLLNPQLCLLRLGGLTQTQ
jgi:hypothetical protein